MKTLLEIAKNDITKNLDKWLSFFRVYELFFSPFQNKDIKILEIGVQGGGSLQIWKKYFGENSRIFGIDIDPSSFYSEERIEIFIGDQENVSFLTEVKEKIGMVDIIIDDGGHTMNQQKVSFNTLFPILKDGGLYLIEDTHTSYWPMYGGYYKNKDSFIESMKDKIDGLHSKHSGEIPKEEFHDEITGLHFYDSIVVIEKGDNKNFERLIINHMTP